MFLAIKNYLGRGLILSAILFAFVYMMAALKYPAWVGFFACNMCFLAGPNLENCLKIGTAHIVGLVVGFLLLTGMPAYIDSLGPELGPAALVGCLVFPILFFELSSFTTVPAVFNGITITVAFQQPPSLLLFSYLVFPIVAGSFAALIIAESMGYYSKKFLEKGPAGEADFDDDRTEINFDLKQDNVIDFDSAKGARASQKVNKTAA